MTTQMKLFTFRCSAFADETLVELPGFSHRSQPEKVRTSWYPFEEWTVKAYLFAKNRTMAAKFAARVSGCRDLDGGRVAVVPDCIAHTNAEAR